MRQQHLFTKGPSASGNLKPSDSVVGKLKMMDNQTPLID